MYAACPRRQVVRPNSSSRSEANFVDRRTLRRFVMRRVDQGLLFLAFLLAAAAWAGAQGDYKVVAVTNGGVISGSVKWSGPAPRILAFPVTKDPQICDP